MKFISLFWTTTIIFSLTASTLCNSVELSEKNDFKISKSIYGIFLSKIYTKTDKQHQADNNNELLNKIENRFKTITDEQFNKMLILSKSRIAEIDPSTEADNITKTLKEDELKTLLEKIPPYYLTISSSEKDALKLALAKEFTNIKIRSVNSLNNLNKNIVLNKIKTSKLQNPDGIFKIVYFTHNIFSPAFGLTMLKKGQESIGSQAMTMIFTGINLGLL